MPLTATTHYMKYLPTGEPLNEISLPDLPQNTATSKLTTPAVPEHHDKLICSIDNTLNCVCNNINFKLVLDPCLVFINSIMKINQQNFNIELITNKFIEIEIHQGYQIANSILTKNNTTRKQSISNNEIPFKLPIVCRKLVKLVKQMKNDPLIDFDPHLCSKLVNVSNIVNSDVNNIGHVNESAIVQVSQNQTNFSNSLSDINLRQDFDCFNYNKNISHFNGLKVQAEIHN